MAYFWRWLVGLDTSPDWVAGGQWRLELQALPQGGWAVAAILAGGAIIATIVVLYQREARETPLALRSFLIFLRLAVLGCVAAMLLELVLVLTKEEQVSPSLLVLVDTSQSMSLKDPYTEERLAKDIATRMGQSVGDKTFDIAKLRGNTRFDLARQALGAIGESLAKDRKVFYYAFSDRLTPTSLEALGEAKPVGAASAVGDALRNALAAHRGQPLAGVLVVSDGQSNVGEEPIRVAQRLDKSQGTPIVTLAAGTTEGPRNSKVVELQASPAVFIRDSADVVALIESRGLKSKTATVVLESRKVGGQWTEANRQEIVLGEDGALQRVAFTFVPDTLGDLEFRAQLTDVGPELSVDDNSASANTRVVRQKIRVLMIAGGPSNEMQFLRNSLMRDDGIDFSSWLQGADQEYEQAGHRTLRRLPSNQQELDNYDVLMLVDPDMAQLPANWSEMITKFVGEAGGGLIYMAGEMFSPKLFQQATSEGATQAWLRVLPVVRDPGLFQSQAEAQLSSRETWVLELTNEGAEDLAFQFTTDPNKNREILSSLPGMFWHFPVTRAKPGATVLARHGDPRMANSFGRHVLLATQLYGPGRTVFVGFDSTFRWRYLNEQYFDGFWARVIDRVGRSKVLGGRYPVTLALDKANYRVGEKVTIVARPTNSEGSATAVGVSAEYEVAGQAAQPLTFEPIGEEAGAYAGSFVANQAGAYTLRAIPGAGADLESGPRAATVHFRVEPPQQEFDKPTLNQPLLEELARSTGGRSLALADASEAPAAFPNRRMTRTLEFRDEIWDAPILFGAIALFVTVEWILRKRSRMS